MEVSHEDPFQGRAEASSGVSHVLMVGPVAVGGATSWGEPAFERQPTSQRDPAPETPADAVYTIGVFEGVWFAGARCCSCWSWVLVEVVVFEALVLFFSARAQDHVLALFA